MRQTLTALILTQNNEETIEKTLLSIKDFVSDVVIVDGYSKDKTIQIVHKVFKVRKVYKVFFHNYFDIGEQRAFGLEHVTGDWVLILDSDEIVTKQLAKEIVS